VSVERSPRRRREAPLPGPYRRFSTARGIELIRAAGSQTHAAGERVAKRIGREAPTQVEKASKPAKKATKKAAQVKKASAKKVPTKKGAAKKVTQT
jgi:hypothetical protein